MANNPHAETYQGKTQFSGPIKAGSRWMPVPSYDRDTVPGTIAVTDLPNTGYVVMSQSAAVQQTELPGSATDIVLPAGSMIIAIQIIVTVAFDATGDNDLTICTKPTSGSAGVLGGYAKLGAVGVYDYADNSNWVLTTWATYALRWKNVSNLPNIAAGDSVDICVDSGGAGGGTQPGRAILTINYIPGLNL